jgi:hypothetical protein
MSDKPKPIPIRDFAFEGLTERKYESFSRHFPKKTTKIVFQMPRTLPKGKKIVQSQRVMRKSECVVKKQTQSHTSFSKLAPVLSFNVGKNYLISQRSERPSFEFASPGNKCVTKTTRDQEGRQRPRTSSISRKIENFSVLKEVKEKKIEKKTEKISVYIKVPEFDYSDYLSELNISK